MTMRGPSFLILDLICYGITKKAIGFYVKILIGQALSKNHFVFCLAKQGKNKSRMQVNAKWIEESVVALELQWVYSTH